ncbi:MAG: Txe/YoeB family addiction module toxin [Deltaproteobacteria bacterium]|nr:MAG: Txe/YoeB family addiction module toxin [Deltaproteobacteria bacterium]
MKIQFSEHAWQEYLYWQGRDKRVLRRINDLLEDIIRRGGFNGIGKPEPLKNNLSGYWSRRIDAKHRLVYRVTGEVCKVIQCKGHYD